MERYGNYKKYLDEEQQRMEENKGFQLRYIYLIDKKKNNRPDNSALKIQEMGQGYV